MIKQEGNTSRRDRTTLWRAALICAAGWWAFAPSRHGSWLWDDDLYITNNPDLRTAAGLGRIWFSPAGVNYFPVTSTVQWVQWHLWGPDPRGYHATNLGLHLLSSLLLWRLLRKLGVKLAWVGGLLFALHPLAVESVAWISELKNTLSLPPLLLAMTAYIDFDGGPSGAQCARSAARANYPWALFWFLVAMLAKSTPVMFPVFLLLYAWWRRGGVGRSDFLASSPFFAVSVGLGAATLWFEHHRAMHGSENLVPAALTLSHAAGAGLALIFYFAKSVFPVGLLPIYPRWPVHLAGPAPWLAGLALAAILVFLGCQRRAWHRDALLGSGWFVLHLTPVLGLIPMGYLRISPVADHFAYLSLAGLAGLAAAGAVKLPGLTWVGVVGAVGAIFAFSSHQYSHVFMNAPALWGYTLQHNPDAWLAHSNIGNSLLQRGEVNEAIGQFRRALELEADAPDTHNNLAAALEKVGAMPEAIAEYRKAVQLAPDNAEMRYNLGMALEKAGLIDGATAEYERTLRLKPEFALAHVNLGVILAEQNRFDSAIAHFEQALRLDPNDSAAHYDLGLVFQAVGRAAEAQAELAAAARLQSIQNKP